MEKDIRKIHEEVLVFLLDAADNGKHLTFSVRKSNRAGKLDQGYWFYGNESYLALSFWTGMDWKNKTPNISFIITNEGKSRLDISTSDSDEKTEFANQYLANTEFGIKYLSKTNKGYLLEYDYFKGDFMSALKYFIEEEKIQIDNIIRNSPMAEGGPIGFINTYEFRDSLKKIEQYRNPQLKTISKADKPSIIAGFRVVNYGPIIDTGLIKVPNSTQWIFLTGENGTGKTSLLKAIASSLCYTKIQNPQKTEIELLLGHDEIYTQYIRKNNSNINKRAPIVAGFCSYGASRLKTNHGRNKFSLSKALDKDGLVDSLFNSEAHLIDIQYQFNYWERAFELHAIVEKRKDLIREVLVDILPNVYDIRFSKQGDFEHTLYIEKDNENKELPPASFDQLASGLKSLVAMIGDMMMRLFNQQPHVSDPSELSGIVIIDEIDIHLHPKLQKYLVEQLTKTFQKVQFLASTHSPIPLLGAPANSAFFKIERDSQTGVQLINLTDINVQSMLPNAILTSDLFNMNNLFTRDESIKTEVRTEDTYERIINADLVKERLAKIDNFLKISHNTNRNEKGE